jgi:hypothetical protein
VQFGEEVYVCGDTPSLGNFNPDHGVQLFASTRSYPVWESEAVMLPKGKLVCYKYAVFSGGKFERWETVKHPRFLLTDDLMTASVQQQQQQQQQPGGGGSTDESEDTVPTTSSDVLNMTPFEAPPSAPAALTPGPAHYTRGQPPSPYGDWTQEVCMT